MDIRLNKKKEEKSIIIDHLLNPSPKQLSNHSLATVTRPVQLWRSVVHVAVDSDTCYLRSLEDGVFIFDFTKSKTQEKVWGME